MGAYLTFSVSESPPTVLALQAFSIQTQRRIMSVVFPVCAIAPWEARDAASGMGYMVMVGLSGQGAGQRSVIDQYPNLLVLNTDRQLTNATTDCPPTRPAHLRMILLEDPNRMLIQRCEHEVIGETIAILSLPRLALAGNAVAGETLLRAMAELHPDVFAPFPGLLSS